LLNTFYFPCFARYHYWLVLRSFCNQLADEEDIVIAKMDATANDVPAPYEVRG
jgi:hypothetical protein